MKCVKSWAASGNLAPRVRSSQGWTRLFFLASTGRTVEYKFAYLACYLILNCQGYLCGQTYIHRGHHCSHFSAIHQSTSHPIWQKNLTQRRRRAGAKQHIFLYCGVKITLCVSGSGKWMQPWIKGSALMLGFTHKHIINDTTVVVQGIEIEPRRNKTPYKPDLPTKQYLCPHWRICFI